MTHSFTHGLGLVFYFFLLWLFLQLSYAAWGSRRASAKWIALVRTPFMQKIGIKYLSVILAVAVALQIGLVVFMLGMSAWTGRPISFK
jgi:hypothetical protein